MRETEKPIILSLGGSLIVPNGGIDTKFLSKFSQFIRRQVKKGRPSFAKASTGRRFFIITGGGFTCRHYQQAAVKVIPNVPNEDLDWLGIHTTRVNAHLIRTIFRDIARPKIIEHYDKEEDVGDYPLVVGSGWKPGWSTDYDAVFLCRDYGARTVINMSNIKKVYTKDPNKFADAKPIKKMTWQKFRAMFGDVWTPGLSAPFDPVASKLAQELGIKVIVLDGRDLSNLERAIEGKRFVGTIIE